MATVTPQSLCENFSVEITAKEKQKFAEGSGALPKGTHVSVTFLPGEDIPMRVETAAMVKDMGFLACPHISARRIQSEKQLEGFLADLQEKVQFDTCFVIAGDPPVPEGPYEDALSIIKTGLLGKYGVKQVNISGYPEGHPDISDEKLWQALRDKKAVLNDLGHDFALMTQFAFDSVPMLKWVEQVRNEGIEEPIRLGVAGPTTVKRLLSFAARCGVGASASVMKKYGFGITQLLTTATPEKLINKLAEDLDEDKHGKVLLHFYPFGAIQATAEWVQDFRAK